MAAATQQDIQDAVNALKQGQLIAYPTEAVFGLGCDPQQSDAVDKLIKLKKRNPDKGLILIAANYNQLDPYLAVVEDNVAERAFKTWPGPVTWLWPAKQDHSLSPLLSGTHLSLAVRVSSHPVVTKLCSAFNGAIVSTSANTEGQPPAKTAQEVKNYFPSGIHKIIDADLGNLKQPTAIFDLLTQAEIR